MFRSVKDFGPELYQFYPFQKPLVPQCWCQYVSAINFQSKTQTLLSDYIVVKIIVEIIVWYSVALLDYVFGFLHHIQAFWSRKNYELVMHPCL